MTTSPSPCTRSASLTRPSATRGSFRVKLRLPQARQAVDPVHLRLAEKGDELRGRRSAPHQCNRPPVDHRTAYENQEKAAERDIIHELVESTGLITKNRLLIDVIKQFVENVRDPAGNQDGAPQGRLPGQKRSTKMTSGQDPVEVVGKYLDYFVRVREVIPIETLVNKVHRTDRKGPVLATTKSGGRSCCCGSSPSSARAEIVTPSMWKN